MTEGILANLSVDPAPITLPPILAVSLILVLCMYRMTSEGICMAHKPEGQAFGLLLRHRIVFVHLSVVRGLFSKESAYMDAMPRGQPRSCGFGKGADQLGGNLRGSLMHRSFFLLDSLIKHLLPLNAKSKERHKGKDIYISYLFLHKGSVSVGFLPQLTSRLRELFFFLIQRMQRTSPPKLTSILSSSPPEIYLNS
ncbi:hypothetical protein VNO77_41977 [Canavalia gladiata]|uniref:Uncharacterized protein n=1 Tax=Canavalia gladiata TaxID=3824 RepID=A0AAN9PSB0_CANGL